MIRLALYLLASVAVRVASAVVRRWAPAVDAAPDAPLPASICVRCGARVAEICDLCLPCDRADADAMGVAWTRDAGTYDVRLHGERYEGRPS